MKKTVLIVLLFWILNGALAYNSSKNGALAYNSSKVEDIKNKSSTKNVNIRPDPPKEVKKEEVVQKGTEDDSALLKGLTKKAQLEQKETSIDEKREVVPAVTKKEAKEASEKGAEGYRAKLKRLTKKARLGQKETLNELEETFTEFIAELHKNKEIEDKNFKFIKEKLK